jgi:hypothetical protein
MNHRLSRRSVLQLPALAALERWRAVDGSPISALPGFPTVLVIGKDALPDAAAIGVQHLHVAALRSNRRCWCSVAHRSCDNAAIRIHIDTPPPSATCSERTLDIVLAPHGGAIAQAHCSIAVAPPGADFDAWSLAAIRNLTEGVLSPGIFAYDTADLRLLFAPPSQLRMILRSGSERFPDLAREAVLDRQFERDTSAVNIGFHGFSWDTISDVSDAAGVIAAAVNVEANIMIFNSIELPWHAITIMFAVPDVR